MASLNTHHLVDRFIDRLLRFEAQGSEALEPLLELFAADAELVNPALDLAGERRVGRDALRRFWQAYRNVLGEAKSRFAEITTSEDAAGLFWTTRATGYEGHGAIEYHGATLLVFDEDGLVKRFRAYFDLQELARTLPPEPADEGERSDAVSDPRQVVSYG